MKKIMKSVWNKIPTVDQLIEKTLGYKKKNINSPIPIILFILLILLTTWIPNLFNGSYLLALGVVIITDIILIILMLSLIKTYKGWLRNVLFVGFAIQIVSVIFMLFPITLLSPTANTSKEHQSNITYVTYSPTCPYCEIAHTNMLRAVAVYNATHGDTIRLINVDKSTKVTKDVLDYIQYKGTIIRFNGNKATQSQYTLGNSKGPVNPSAAYIYKELTSIK